MTKPPVQDQGPGVDYEPPESIASSAELAERLGFSSANSDLSTDEFRVYEQPLIGSDAQLVLTVESYPDLEGAEIISVGLRLPDRAEIKPVLCLGDAVGADEEMPLDIPMLQEFGYQEMALRAQALIAEDYQRLVAVVESMEQEAESRKAQFKLISASFARMLRHAWSELGMLRSNGPEVVGSQEVWFCEIPRHKQTAVEVLRLSIRGNQLTLEHGASLYQRESDTVNRAAFMENEPYTVDVGEIETVGDHNDEQRWINAASEVIERLREYREFHRMAVFVAELYRVAETLGPVREGALDNLKESEQAMLERLYRLPLPRVEKLLAGGLEHPDANVRLGTARALFRHHYFASHLVDRALASEDPQVAQAIPGGRVRYID